MRTAEEILNKYWFTRQDPEVDMDTLIAIINEARIEAIKECAEISKVFCHNKDSNEEYFSVDKQSILKLLDQTVTP
jgi:hypothetical protein